MRRYVMNRRTIWISGVVTAALLAVGCPSTNERAGRQSPDSHPSDSEVVPAVYQEDSSAYGAAGGTGSGDRQQQIADAVKRNGAIFVDWPTPQVALVISGEQLGFLEPCGCAGLENQKGGMKRRHTLIKQLKEKGWPLALVDLGGQVRRYGPQAVIKFRTAINSLVKMGYRAVAFGPQDLRLPADELVGVAVNLPEGKNPYVSANVGLFGMDGGFVAPSCVVDVGGKRIGITSILGATAAAKINNDDIEIIDAAAALRPIAGKLRETSDFRILLSHASPDESRALARQFPEFDAVVASGGAGEPPNKPEIVEGTQTLLIEVGQKGMYVAVLGLYDDPQKPWRYQRVPLDHRFENSREMQQALVDYQKELKTLGLQALGATGRPHPSGRTFVGSATCADCHTEATDVFEKTPHSHATATLVKLDPPRHFDPECLSCHVIGWDPQKYVPFNSGYKSLTDTPNLLDNGCENCHGPGSRHVAAEQGDVDADDEQLEKLRAEMRIRLIEGEAEGKLPEGVVGRVTTMCRQCHDLDNSPDFDFKTYWPKVKHEGKE